MEFTAKDVMALRERSGAGMMDCKKALKECDGDIEKALDYLREKSLAASAKKASRIAAEGLLTASFVKNAASASSSKSTAKPTLLQRPTISKTLLLPLQSMLQRKIPLPLKI